MQSKRDYDRFADELLDLASPPQVCVFPVGDVDGYTLFGCRVQHSTSSPPAKRVLLASGTHGDEPAGPEAALRFLNLPSSPLLEGFRFLVLPCINPHGYCRDTRENAEGRDINRSFAGPPTPESALVKELLDRESFDLMVDFHEDWEHSGYYLWEGRRRGIPEVGPAIIRAVGEIGPVYAGHSLDDFAIESGVIAAEDALIEYERRGIKSLLTYVYGNLADHGITSETPSQWRMEDRIRAHCAALDVVLRHYA